MPTVTQATVLNEALDAMEEDLRITKTQAKDFIESIAAVVEEHLASAEKVSLLGLTVFTPSFVLAKPKRKGVNPRTGEARMLDPRPAKLRVKASVPKRFSDALPGPGTAAARPLKEQAQERARKAAERLAAREAADGNGAAPAETKKAAKKTAPRKKTARR